MKLLLQERANEAEQKITLNIDNLNILIYVYTKTQKLGMTQKSLSSRKQKKVLTKSSMTEQNQ